MTTAGFPPTFSACNQHRPFSITLFHCSLCSHITQRPSSAATHTTGRRCAALPFCERCDHGAEILSEKLTDFRDYAKIHKSPECKDCSFVLLIPQAECWSCGRLTSGVRCSDLYCRMVRDSSWVVRDRWVGQLFWPGPRGENVTRSANWVRRQEREGTGEIGRNGEGILGKCWWKFETSGWEDEMAWKKEL